MESSGKEECGIIKVDIVRKSPTYEITGNVDYYGCDFTVLKKDIENATKLIKDSFSLLGVPCTRIYLSGYTLLTKNYACTEDRILDKVISTVKTVKSYEQGSIISANQLNIKLNYPSNRK